jgi:hemolysin type calcium-binding protein
MRRVGMLLAAMALALLLTSGVAWAVNEVGTNGPDTLRGTDRADNLLGRGGNDTLFGLGGRDNLSGGPGKDWVLGGSERRAGGGDKNLEGGSGNDGVLGGRGSDNMVGGAGNDLLDGFRGSDRMVGDKGNDLVVDGPDREFSTDTLLGGPGNDVLGAANSPAFKDVMVCGRGFDRVSADRKDVVADDCELVFTGRAAGEELFEELEESGFFERFFGGLAPDPFGGG